MKKKKGAALEQAMGPISSEKDMEWEHKRNHDTVMDALEIMGDPTKMKHVRKLAGRKMKAIRSLKDLHNTLNEKYGPEAESEMEDKLEGGESAEKKGK